MPSREVIQEQGRRYGADTRVVAGCYQGGCMPLVHGAGHDQDGAFDLINGVHVVLHNSFRNRFVKTVCRSNHYMERGISKVNAPDLVNASSKSNAASFSFFCSSEFNDLRVGVANNPFCSDFVHTPPSLIVVGLKALSVSIRSKQASSSCGTCV